MSKLPTPSELTELVSNKIITPEEAKAILVETKDDQERDKDSLKEEIKFLRELIEKLSENKPSVIREYIQSSPIVIEKHAPWVYPYQVWCSTNNQLYSSGTLTNCTTGLTGSQSLVTNCSFSQIENF